MFRASSAHLEEDTIAYLQHMVLSLSIRVRGGLSVHSLSEDFTQAVYRQATTNCDSTICCMYTTVSSWRWALQARNM